jgi:hypothetical protein
LEAILDRNFGLCGYSGKAGGEYAMALESLALAGAKGFAGALGKLAAEHAARTLMPAAADRIRTDIEPHIEATYRRCSTTKTLLNPLHPVEVLKIYASQMFSVRKKELDQYDLVDCLRSDINNSIITGTGGSGKSIFTKYLWLSLFERSDGRIPIYVELRQLNNIDKTDIIPFLIATLSQGKSRISEREFRGKLERGDLFLVFDGFDELVEAKREPVQIDIMNLSTNYPDLKIVVSSRPDNRFASWTSFHVISVLPMRQKDVIELVEKAEFDRVVKRKFIKRMKDDSLYERHNSFMSNPLLASMMLLTYSHNYDVPDKMHLFYDHAFEALYQRHDSHKSGGFKREFKTSISVDVFKRILAYFCLITYTLEKYEFSEPELLQQLANAINIEKADTNAQKFFSDLVNCVCILIPDGINYTFSHRSLQEYFAAYCLAYVTRHNFRKIVGNWSARSGDSAVELLSEMNPDVFREEYIVPIVEDNADLLKSGNSFSLQQILDATGLIVSFIRPREDNARGASFIAPSPDTKELGYLLLNLNSPANFGKMIGLFAKDSPETELLDTAGTAAKARVDLLYIASENGRIFYSVASQQLEHVARIGHKEELDGKFSRTAISKALLELYKATCSGAAKYRRESARKGRVLTNLLDFSQTRPH